MTALDGLVAALPPIALDELNARAALLRRVDSKYFAPRAALAELLEAIPELRVLEIGGHRSFRYRTVYYDSAAFTHYREHVQGRRHRFKVRVRTYCDSGDCMLEVKSKGYRGQTVKDRRPRGPRHPDALDADERAFVSSITGRDAAVLRPVLETVYDRTTLCAGDQRITLDTDLTCAAGDRRGRGPDDVLVETKSPDGRTGLDRALVHAGVRPHSVSKYCVAAALLYPQLPRNRWHRTLQRSFALV
ncbi:polyphosphate polymerase domain-containing protein [Microbacterium horticulturae]|uniref:Polyphosphate polymerase domain-containing protein n=1 Tax=Microbacterium horticulturae TaxID=3028316 RepID=A0ABY8BVN2_9MICO|nr:polyphosphate polymerase domain-containing protein [Microbacterium sp. KACC 23027]WEG08245.1 polyphosphate polymerase domain-containing protein [Microbacterium sp. KACC 23027]